ncbi:hypothetical protein GGR02_002863 [Anoxybacillus voinovskiensis]|uniref:Uncharacterized protein n=1 Tax=Anoxybacteroides voinovskiense TaxID=230470 RepID=A0A840DU58_9BACL|nr:hypothetical protein [Anoxybacillus voinovskiensis]MBB4075062.1 hypothetical protein [Anoxybacillus voinovskiensis]GGJ76538.1 hypothetical protein GCM10008982_27300 [Anoxybacillus voinovskiensis]
MSITKEEMGQVLSVLLQQLVSDWTKEKIHSDVLEVIMKMRIDTANEDDYMHVLVTNVAFATESTYALQQIFQTVLESRTFPPAAAVEKMLKEAQARIHDELPNIVGRYEAHFAQIADQKARKQQLERSYCAVLVANRIKTDFILSFIHEENQAMMKGFFDAEREDVLEAFHRLSGAYASLLLDGLELDY